MRTTNRVDSANGLSAQQILSYLNVGELTENFLIEAATENNAQVRSRVVSGQYLVVGLLMLGIAATVLMFVYWEQHTRPFRSLREAIGREFRHSRPNVEGGRQKGRGPKTLRITMSVEFPPGEDSPKANKIVDRVREIVEQYTEPTQFEKVEVNLIQFVPQELAKTRTFTWVPGETSGVPQKAEQ